MKSIKTTLAALLAIITILSVIPMSAFAAASSFTDVPQNAWYYEPVTYMAENGYMSGTGDNKFSPNQTTTRAMFVTVLGRIAGIDQNQYKGTCTFRDVKKDWAEPYIAWASQNNIVNGVGDNRFGPNNYVTREQAALILFNYLKRDYTLTIDSKFLDNAPDKVNVSSWAVEAMQWATSAALMRGDANGTLRPRYSATRAEIATIFKRFIEIKEDLDANKPDVPTTCDHEWEVTKTENVTLLTETVREWAHADALDTVACNGCNMNIAQWMYDNADKYSSPKELSDAMCILGDETGCPQLHGGNHSTDNGLPLTFGTMSEKIYKADMPSEETCTKCNTVRPCVSTRIINSISDENVWERHTKEVLISEAWDEPLYTIIPGYNISTSPITFVPVGTLIDTIHHPRRVNNEIAYFENVETHERIYVEMTGCRHPEWKDEYSGHMAPIFHYCTSCNAKNINIRDLYNS
ncbi:S-layer homology domain-containing protein [Acutalibacter intestini]|uniref:S-layer homology domain-containing protein n=1 Tax=Acutalibacter intestini TaxID=3093659 RepID=UPI002AC95597|nr:S-layer homology domain-containing protein [Acutalibacter sp. M00204]